VEAEVIGVEAEVVDEITTSTSLEYNFEIIQVLPVHK